MHDDCALGPVSNSNSNSDSARDFEMATADPEFLRRYSVPHLPLPFPLDKDVFIPDPSLGSKRTKSLVFREYIPIKTLGNGRYGAVKEAMHVKTGQHVAMKVINKSLIKRTEFAMIENEIQVLEKVSLQHPNVIHLYAHFTIANELYLIMDLCTGGELFDLICELGSFYEDDAQRIIHVLLEAVSHLHDNGIVHRDLKPENILIRQPVEIAVPPDPTDVANGSRDNGTIFSSGYGAANGTSSSSNGAPNGQQQQHPPPKFSPKRDIVLADFGISRMIEPHSSDALKTRIGSPGYMAPEVIKGEKYGSAVDIWAIGVITYLLLSGYMPFHDDEMLDEFQNVMLGRYSFDPPDQWSQISDEAKDFIRLCLSPDAASRPTAKQAMQHPWLATIPETHEQALSQSTTNTTSLHNVHPETNLLPIVVKNFDAKRRFRRVINTVRMLNRLKIGMSDYADRMTRVGRYGMDSFSSSNSNSFRSNSDEPPSELRKSETFEFNTLVGLPASSSRESLNKRSPLSIESEDKEEEGLLLVARHHSRSKSGSRSIERVLTH